MFIGIIYTTRQEKSQENKKVRAQQPHSSAPRAERIASVGGGQPTMLMLALALPLGTNTIIPNCNITALEQRKAATTWMKTGSGARIPATPCGRIGMSRSDICTLMMEPPTLPAGVFSSRVRLHPDRQIALEQTLEPKSGGARMVEVGTFSGAFARYLLQQFRPSELLEFDMSGWAIMQCETRTRQHAVDFNTTLRCLSGASAQRMPQVLDDGAHDLIYIDGDHAYRGVCADLEAARSKVRVGGLLVVNDYHLFETVFLPTRGRWGVYGVMHAANEFLLRYSPDWEIAYYTFAGAGNGGDLAMRRLA